VIQDVDQAREAQRLLRSIFGPIDGSDTHASFVGAHRATAMQIVELVKEGVPAQALEVVAKAMDVPKVWLAATLGLARATVDRKARANQRLSVDESSRVLGIARLLGQVETMVTHLGSEEATEFNPAHWVAAWLEQPLPALGGRRPADLMDTAEGQAVVAETVARMQSGAYA
jgi:putative toxin-antitoxin system antitoxin component (TIGR02293 family)